MRIKYIIASIFSIVCLITGCQDLDKLNKNPNNPTKAEPFLILPNVSKKAFSMNGISKEYATRMIVQTDGENVNQFFKWTNGGFGTYDVMKDINKMMEEADRKGELGYVGIGHFLKAKYFYNLTLTFGDIPYTDALQGEDKLYFPKYDSQEIVFEGILDQLELASHQLKEAEAVKGDIIYKGDIKRWEKLVSSFKLKVLITLSKKITVGKYDVKKHFNKVFTQESLIDNNQENGQILFFDVAGSRYPQFNSSSYGSSMYMSSTFINLLKELEDPRLFVFAQQTAKALEEGKPINDFSSYNGGDPTVPYAENELLVQTKNISKVNSRYYADPVNEPNFILSYAELQFILAEAVVRGWITGDAEGFYNKGIEGSFGFYEVYAKSMSHFFKKEAYTSYNNSDKVKFKKGSQVAMIEQILTQKYLIMFHQAGWDIYFDHLRTGFPKFKTIEGVTPPTRWLYPTSEYNRNQENLKVALDRQFGGNDNIRAKVWWLK